MSTKPTGKRPKSAQAGDFISYDFDEWKSRPVAEPEVFSGYFRFHETGSMESPRFTVEDDDGMGFVLDGLRRFEGLLVKITVERVPAPPPDNVEPPDIYRAIGLTSEAYTKERLERRRAIYRRNATLKD